MKNSRLKVLRVGVALTFFAGLLALLLGKTVWVPVVAVQWLAAVQFVPSLVAFATGVTASFAFIVILVASLLAGRIYCAAICPLGILQDVVGRLSAWLSRKKRLRRFVRVSVWPRQVFLWGTVAGVAAGWSGLALTLTDPYSNFGRIASLLFRPFLQVLGRLVFGLVHLAGSPVASGEPVLWGGFGVLAVPAFVLTLVVAMEVYRERFYCNSVCPVGTLLGLFSKWSAYRVTIDSQACRKCGECAGVCKAQCIDLRRGVIDGSRCVACFNCLGVCDSNAISYGFTWRRKPRVKTTLRPTEQAAAAADPQRRAFLSATVVAAVSAAGASKVFGMVESRSLTPQLESREKRIGPITPPGAGGTERLLERCTACQLCVSACPTQVLRPAFLEYGVAGFAKPRLDFTTASCDFGCRRCGEVCPDGAIGPLALAEKQVTRIGMAHFEPAKCRNLTKGFVCTLCVDHCPTKALALTPDQEGLCLPRFQPLLCIGCGACEHVCPVRPTKAITVLGRRIHNRARKAVDQGAIASLLSPHGSTQRVREPALTSNDLNPHEPFTAAGENLTALVTLSGNRPG